MLLERLEDLVRIQFEVAHDLRKRVPLDLREREKNVFIRQQCVITSPRFLDGAIHDALGGFADLALCDVEVVHGIASSCCDPGPGGRRESASF
jgi:hypothetical protein